jgi:uncharacterized protein YyaL (SSP411 family)
MQRVAIMSQWSLAIIIFIAMSIFQCCGGSPMSEEYKEMTGKSNGRSGEGFSDKSDDSDKAKKENRLAFEKSPYLLQHADNPIDWYPWGEEAFQKAKKEDKPVFLSIGYSSCHWCHVMEHESFEDEEVAKLLNQNFVSIKVDREERPDVDNIYMTVCQSMTGSGGWPLTIIMAPDKKPFFAGTYFPKESKFGRPGLMQLLRQVTDLWKDDRAKLLQIGDQMARNLRAYLSVTQAGKLSEENLKQAFHRFQQNFDALHGGFGSAPKFPTPHNLSFLLRWWARSGDEEAFKIVEKTLDGMWRGGMYDHLGLGFHRYSTDRQWLIPHFEKMLYDQAMLAIAYIETYQATGKKKYARVAEDIFNYVLRDMTSQGGAFYSAEDADSEGEEGKFYVWAPEEIAKILGKDGGKLFSEYYGVTERGNFEHGKSALHVKKEVEEFAKERKMKPEELERILEGSRQKLFAVREKRIHPLKDDKILTDWNGLMIAALAKGAQAFDKPEYADAAQRSVDFLLKNLRRKDGRLLHRFREGEAIIPGYLDDYAFLTWGLIELYQATFDVRYLQEAQKLTEDMIKSFWDEKEGGFYFTADDSEELIAKMKEVYDGAVPSGNSVAALNLLRLGRLTMNEKFLKRAERHMESFGGKISNMPAGFTQFLIALDFALGPSKEIVIAGNPDDEKTKRMLEAVHSRFIPNKVLILHPDGEEGKAIESLVPFVKQQKQVNGKVTAYICENYLCNLPTSDVEKMISLLESP